MGRDTCAVTAALTPRGTRVQPAGETEPKQGLKYWTGFTVMYSTRQDEKTIKARAQKRAKEREMRAKIKWRELGGLFAYLRMPSRPCLIDSALARCPRPRSLRHVLSVYRSAAWCG